MLSHIQTVLFDLDGTIANTNDLILRTIADTLECETGRIWHREALLPHWGMRLRDQLMTLHPAIDLERAVTYYRQRYAEHEHTLMAEFPGIRALLEGLQAQGYTLGVVTSKKRLHAQATVDGLGYAPFLSLVVAEEDTPRHKPAPDPLWYALAQLNAPAETALYVGDNPDDVIAARAAGMAAVAVGWCLRPREELIATAPDAIIDDPADLLTLLGCATCTA